MWVPWSVTMSVLFEVEHDKQWLQYDDDVQKYLQDGPQGEMTLMDFLLIFFLLVKLFTCCFIDALATLSRMLLLWNFQVTAMMGLIALTLPIQYQSPFKSSKFVMATCGLSARVLSHAAQRKFQLSIAQYFWTHCICGNLKVVTTFTT